MSDAGYSMLGAGVWGWPREMLWGGRWEGGSCLGTRVRIKDFKIKKNKKAKKNKSIISSVLSFVYSPTLTSIHDHWKNHSLDQMDFVGKVMSLLLNMLSRLVITFLPRSKRLNFMAALTICSDFGAQENSLSVFPLFPHLFVMKWWDWMPCS